LQSVCQIDETCRLLISIEFDRRRLLRPSAIAVFERAPLNVSDLLARVHADGSTALRVRTNIRIPCGHRKVLIRMPEAPLGLPDVLAGGRRLRAEHKAGNTKKGAKNHRPPIQT